MFIVKKATAIWISFLLLGLIFTPTFIQAEEVKVPFGAVKPSCYGKIDMSKAEFSLSEIGKECVTENWLRENKPKEEDPSEETTQTENKDYTTRVIPGSEEDVVNVSWEGYLSRSEENLITVEVHDDSYVHENYIEGEKKPTVTLLIFHKDRTGWGKSIQDLPKEKFQGPGGFMEKTKVPLKREGKKWIGEAKVNLKKSVTHISIWKSQNSSKDGEYGLKLIAKEVELKRLAEGQPTLEEVEEIVDTPEELVKFMSYYFKEKHHEGHTAYPPKKFLKIKQGNCKDYAVFGAHILKENGYKAKQLVYSPDSVKGGHAMFMYREKGELYYIDKKLSKFHIFGPFPDIEAVLRNQAKRPASPADADEKITCYAVAAPAKLSVEKPCLFAQPEE